MNAYRGALSPLAPRNSSGISIDAGLRMFYINVMKWSRLPKRSLRAGQNRFHKDSKGRFHLFNDY
jgi:hypothetical protein